jgi:hypothetical protein
MKSAPKGQQKDSVNSHRRQTLFAPQNLIMDPPFTKLDILSCRNLLIYLAPEMQKKLIPLFHYSLNPGGILFLGSTETIGGFTDLFASLDGKSRVCRRTESEMRAGPVEFPSSFKAPQPDWTEVRLASKPPISLQIVADQQSKNHDALERRLTNKSKRPAGASKRISSAAGANEQIKDGKKFQRSPKL